MTIGLRASLIATLLVFGLPLGLTATLATPSFATAPSVGSVMCNDQGSISFNPPLTPSGTPGKKEKVSISETLSNCQSSNPSVTITNALVKVKTIKLPAEVAGTNGADEGEKVVGACDNIEEELSGLTLPDVRIDLTYDAVNQLFSSRRKETENELAFLPMTPALDDEAPFVSQVSGGGFVSLYISQTSSQALESCISGSGGPISTLTSVPTPGGFVLGPTVLTSGRLGGPSVPVGAQVSYSVSLSDCNPFTATGTVTEDPPAGLSTELLAEIYNLSAGTSIPNACTIPAGALGNAVGTLNFPSQPYVIQISGTSGFPVVIPNLTFSVSVLVGTGPSAQTGYCPYNATNLPGNFLNATNSIAFSTEQNTHLITAQYSGDCNFNGSSTASPIQEVITSVPFIFVQ
jgi:hypothetical protein